MLRKISQKIFGQSWISSKTFLFFVLLHLVLLIGLGFTAWPEMSLWPYLVSKGWLPYKDIAIAHTPGLIFLVSIFYRIFGLGIIQLKVFTWILILGTDLILYFVVKKLWNKKTALISLAFYIFVQLIFEGNGLWFESLLALLGIFLFYLLKQKKYFCSGFVFILMFLVKQTAAWLVFPLLVTIYFDNRKKTKEVFHSLEYILPGILSSTLIFVLVLAFFKLIPDFYNWAIKFGIFYLPRASGQINVPSLKQMLWVMLTFTPVIYLLFFKREKDNLLLIPWILFSLLGIIPRWELFHFQPALPFLAIVFAISFSEIQFKAKLKNIVLFSFVVLFVFQFVRFLLINWKNEVRFWDKDVQAVVTEVNKFKTERIYVVNYWDNIYAFTNTFPAVRPWVPYLPWYMEYDGVKKEVVSQIKLKFPEVIIRQRYSQEGLSAYKINDLENLIQKFYLLEKTVNGEVDIFVKNK